MVSNVEIRQGRIKVLVLAVVSTFFWGSAFPMIKLGYEHFGIVDGSPFDKIIFAGYRFFLGGLLTIILLSIFTKEIAIPTKMKNWKRLFILGLVQTAVHYAFFYLGIGNTTGAKSAIITGSATFFLVILGAIFTKNDPITIKKAAGCLIGFIGVILINWSFGGSTVELTLIGDGFVLISAAIFAVGNIMSRFITEEENPVLVSGWQLLFGGLLLILAGWLGGGQLNEVSMEGIMIFIYLVLISVGAFVIWTYLLKNNPVSSVSIYFFLNPTFGVVLSGVFLNEDVFTVKNMVSLIIVCMGIIIVNAKAGSDEQQCEKLFT